MVGNKTRKIGRSLKIKNEKAEYNKGYLKVAARLKYLKAALVALLLLVVCGGFMFVDELSLNNIAALWRYVDRATAGGHSAAQGFRIDADEHAQVGLYRNNIAVLRRSRLDIFDLSGRRVNFFNIAYSNPVLRISERYILAFDIGANNLGIFNASHQVFEHLGDNPVFNARVTDRGYVVYVTREPGYQSVVRVLNSDFAKIFAAYRARDFVTDAYIDNAGRRLVIAGYDARDGDFVARLVLFDTRAQEPVREIEIRGERPYRVKLNDSGFVAVLGDSVRFYNLSGEQVAAYRLAGRTLQRLELGAEYSAVILNERMLGNSRILVFDNAGNIIWERVAGAEIKDAAFGAGYDYLYYLSRTGLYEISLREGSHRRVTARVDGHGAAVYDETARRIIFAGELNIILAGLAKVNILER